MWLATFEIRGRESWGVIVYHPALEEEWIFEPLRVEEALQLYANPTSGYYLSQPRFLISAEWPADMVSLEAR